MICLLTTCVCLFILRTYHDEKNAVFDYTYDNNLTTVPEIRLVERHQPRRFLLVIQRKGLIGRRGCSLVVGELRFFLLKMKRTSVKEKSS